MLKTKTCLAIATLTAIEHHRSLSENRISSATLVQRYQLPHRALEATLQLLARHGFVRSLRGGQGGYEVIHPDKLNLANIVQQLQDSALPEQPLHAFQPILEDAFASAQQSYMKQLEHITIKHLANNAQTQGLSAQLEPLLNFSI